jgi:hypothetical protein
MLQTAVKRSQYTRETKSKSSIYLSFKNGFSMFLCSERNTRDVGRTREKFENHEPKGSSYYKNFQNITRTY